MGSLIIFPVILIMSLAAAMPVIIAPRKYLMLNGFFLSD